MDPCLQREIEESDTMLTFPNTHLGIYGSKISEMASKRGSNASRGLHLLVHKHRRTLNVQVDAVQAPIKLTRQRKVELRPWPVLHLSSWAKMCMEDELYGGFFMLGGHSLSKIQEVELMLENFWQRYDVVEPGNMPPFPKRTIGFFIHGDEGRGQVKRPLLVISFQCIISWIGEQYVISKKQLGLLLFQSSKAHAFRNHACLEEALVSRTT